jgi:hypothetical protein
MYDESEDIYVVTVKELSDGYEKIERWKKFPGNGKLT